MARLGTALLLALLVAAPAWAQQNGAQRKAERAALRQKLRATPGEWVRDLDRWVPVRPGLCNATECGTVRIGKLGAALVVRTYVPESREGQPGFAVHQLVKAIPAALRNPPSPTAGSKHSAEEAKVKQAFLQVVKHASGEFLRAEPLSALYGGALSGVAASGETDKVCLYRTAMKGIAGSLDDRYTCYMEPKAARAFDERSKPVQTGAGMRLEPRGDGRLLVKEVLPGPAERAGLRRGDQLLSVGDHLVTSPASATELLQGRPGDRRRLEILRDGRRQRLELTIGEFRAYPISSALEGGVAVIRLPKFYNGSARDVIAKIGELESSSGGRLRGLVLDLRGNPGGSRPEWVRLLNEFLAGGSLGENRGQGGRRLESFTASPEKAGHPTLPLALLVDGKSASASERMAAVLKDRRRALIVGEPTFGKDIGQTTHSLVDGSSFKVTNVRFHVPSGAAPGAITPHVTTAQAIATSLTTSVDPLVGYAVRALLQPSLR